MATQTIVAYFDSRQAAEAAQAALSREGIGAGAVRLLPEEGSTYARSATETSYDHRSDTGGFFGALGDLFLPDEDRYTYAEGMSRGGVTLSVSVDDAHYARAAEILEDAGAVNIDEREAEWRSTGWTGYSGAATGVATAGRDALADDEGTIQVMEESLSVGKRVTEGGRVRIRTYVVETPVQAEVELTSSRVTIERRPVDRAATDADFTTGERVLEAREHREEAVVSKEARVVEEIGLRSETESHTETVSDSVRKTEVEIEDERTGARTSLTGETITGGTGRDRI